MSEPLIPHDAAAARWVSEAARSNEGTTDPDRVTVCVADVPTEMVEWLWHNRIPLGKPSIIAGNPDVGKTMLTADIAARVSTGRPFPDCPDIPNPPGGVLFINGEDGLGDTIKPRLIAAGADLTRIRAIPLLGDPGTKRRRWFTLADIPTMERAIRETPECKLVVIDPVSAFLGDCNENQNGDVRGLVGPLADVASRLGVAIVLVTHPNKSIGQRAIHRMLGSVGWVGAARSAWLVVKESGDGPRRLLLRVKGNLGPETPGLAYTIEGDPPRAIWDPQPVNMSADQALAAEAEQEEERSALDEAVDWLRERLTGCPPVPALTVIRDAKSAGISKRTLDRAKARLRVESRPTSFRGPHVWTLPDAQTSPEPAQCAIPMDVANSDRAGEVCGNDEAGGVPI